MLFRDLAEGLSPDELAMLGRVFDCVCAELTPNREVGSQADREHIAKLILKLASHGGMDEATLHTAVIAEVRRGQAVQP